jgi:hypothetical protein
LILRLFGFEFRRTPKENYQSFVPQTKDDGTLDISAGGAYGTFVDLQGVTKNDVELIGRYRQMAQNPEVDWAVQQITNEAITIPEEDEEDIVQNNVMEAIHDEFEECQRLLDFKNHAHDIFTRFYVDSRLNYHVIIDKDKPQEGIKELRYVDPRKIRKVREIDPKLNNKTPQVQGTEVVADAKQEYYIYNPQGFAANQYLTGHNYSPPTTGLKIAPDAVVQVTSGLTDITGSVSVSYLHKAIKALNQFSMLEDAAIIYRLARAPERRIFYVDVGNLPRAKAEQYIRDMMTRWKNRLVYDQATGELRDDRRFPTMLEDFWFPRRGNSKATEIDVLPPGQSQDILEELEYFLHKLLSALNIPYNRSHPDNNFPIGAEGSIAQMTRDEVMFSKFIDKVRNRFAKLFTEVLKRQLALKNIINVDTWEQIEHKIKFRWAKDNVWTEIKERQALNEKFETATAAAPYVGRYFSHNWMMKTIFGMTEEEIEDMQDEILDEANNPILNPIQVAPEEGIGGPGMQQDDGQDNPFGQPPQVPPQQQGQEQGQENQRKSQDARDDRPKKIGPKNDKSKSESFIQEKVGSHHQPFMTGKEVILDEKNEPIKTRPYKRPEYKRMNVIHTAVKRRRNK